MAPALSLSARRAVAAPVDPAARLIADIRNHDRQALRALYDLKAPCLLALLLRAVPVQAQAEDVLADVFVAIWRQARSFDMARDDAGVWLFAVLRTTAIEALGCAGAAPLLAGRQPAVA